MKKSLYIIKIGGRIIEDNARLSSLLECFAHLESRKILVHGGGKLATQIAEKTGIEQKLVDGRRITDAETLKIVTMVYAGYINKNIVAMLQAHHCNAIGLCGADGNLILAHKRKHPVMDYGFAGDIDAINIDLIKKLLAQNLTIVLAPITHDQNGQLLNTNADTIAQEIAKAMSREFDTELIYLFEKSGVLLDVDDESTVIKKITWETYQKLKDTSNTPSDLPDSKTGDWGKIFSGMIPKLDNAFSALNNGVKKVIIGKADDLKGLIAGTSGTTIQNEE